MAGYNNSITDINSKVGIGTGQTEPASKLEINGVTLSRGGTFSTPNDTRTDVGPVIAENDFIYTLDGSSDYLRRLIGKTSDIIQIGEPGTSLIDGINLKPGGTGGYVQVYNNASVVAKFVDGKLGIGTTNIDEKLQVEEGNIKIEGGANSSIRGLILAHTGQTGNQTLLVQNSTNPRGHLYTTERPLRIEAGEQGSAAGGTLDFWVNQAERMMIDTNGNVGIGVTNPGDKLTVNGNLSIFGNKIYNGSASNSAGVSFPSSTTRIDGFNGITFHSSATTVGSQTERMRIDSAGNVGIGTTSPGYLLDLYKSTGTSSTTTGTTLQRLWNYVGSDIKQQKTFIDFVFQDNNTNEYPQVRIGAEVGRNGDANTQEKEGSGAFVVYTNNATGVGPGSPTGLAERFRVDYAGNVGIGTTNPASTLHVLGPNAASGGITLSSSTSDNTQKVGRIKTSHYSNSEEPFTAILTNAQTSNNILRLGGGSGGENAATEIIFYTATNNTTLTGSERMRIASSGNVGIGTTSPDDILQVNQGSSSFRGITIEGTSPALYLNDTQASNAYHIGANGNYLYFLEDSNKSGSYNNILAYWDPSNNFIFNSAYVGIGTTSPTQKLHVAGNLRVTGAYYDSNNSPGTANQVLVSTVTGTDWIDGSAIPGVPGGSGTTNYLARWTPDGDTLGNSIVFDNGTNVGIGTSSVGTYKLNVDGAIRIGVSGTIQPLLSRDSATGGLIISSVGNSGDLIFQGTGGSEKFRIKDTGNVGIGTTSPNGKLTIGEPNAANKGDFDFQQIIYNGGWSQNVDGLAAIQWSDSVGSSNTIGRIGVTYTGSQGEFQIKDLYNGGYAGSGKVFAVRGDGRAYFTGNVGIGTTSPSVQLEVANKSLTRHTSSSWGQSAIANPNDSEVAFVWAAGGTGYPGVTSTYTRQWIAGLSPFNTGTDRWSLTNKTLGANTAITVLEDGKIGMGTTSPGNILVVESGASSSAVEFVNTNADANPSGLILKKLSASPADNDILGRIVFQGNNDATTPGLRTFARIETVATDVTDGQEDGSINFYTTNEGTQSEKLRILDVGAVQSRTSGLIQLNYRNGSAYQYVAPTLYNMWNRIGTFTAPNNSAKIMTEILAKGDNNYPKWMKGTVVVSFYSTGVSVSCQTDGGFEGGYNFQCIVTRDGTTYDVWLRVPNIEWSSFVSYRTLNNSGFTENYVFTTASGNISQSAPTGVDDETNSIEPNSSYRFVNTDLKTPTHQYKCQKFLINGSETVKFQDNLNYFTQKVGIGTTSPDNLLHVQGSNNPRIDLGEDTNNKGWMRWNNADNYIDFTTRVGGTYYADTLVLRNDNVGIRETNPQAPLHISRDNASGENIALILDNNNTTAGNEIGVLFRSMVGSSNTDFEIFGKANGANDMDLVFQSDGSNERVRFTGDGKVGIGDNNPTTNLSVVGSIGTDDIFMTATAASSSGTAFVVNEATQLVTRTAAQVLADIGAAPATGGAYLPLAGGTMTGNLKLNDNVELRIGSSNDLKIVHESNNNSYIQNITGDLYIRNFADNKDIIFQSDNGSGSATTYFMLDGERSDASNVYTVFPDNSIAGFGNSANLKIYYSSSKAYLDTTLNVDLVIPNAEVGIGTTSPDVKLHVTENEDGSGLDKGTAKFINTNTGQGATTMHMVQTSSGNFANAVKFWQGSTPTAVGFIRLTTSATQFITSASDLNLKKNITNWSDDTLGKFKALEPKKFRFKTQDVSEDKTLGFIAQNEVDNFPEAYPQFLSDDEKPYYGFNPTGMVPHLMKAIKDLVEKVETLENKITQLENNN